VTRDGKAIDITQREFRLLEYFARNAGQLLTRSMIYEAVWDYKFDPGTNLIDVHIGRLRRKIDREDGQSLIVTVRGNGWMIDAPP
jgi:two-component system OmpR family response regulator